MLEYNYICLRMRLAANICLLLFGLWVHSLSAQLSGAYTIGGKAVTRNFTDWDAFLKTFHQKGVSSKVTLTVRDDFVLDTCIIFKVPSKNPTNSKNTLTINGSNKWVKGKHKEGLIQLVGADYITIRNLHIENNSSESGVVGLRMGQRADYNTIDSCDIFLSGLSGFKQDSGAYVAIGALGKYLGVPIEKHAGIGNTIKNGHFYPKDSNSAGPYFGIYDRQGSKDYGSISTNNQFVRNRIDGFYSRGIYMAYVNGERCESNDVSREHLSDKASVDSTVMGILCLYGKSGSQSLSISGNSIHDLPKKRAVIPKSATYPDNIKNVYGINLWYAVGTSKYPVEIIANKIKDLRYHTLFSGILTQYGVLNEVIENSFSNAKGYTGYSYAMYANFGEDIRIDKNEFKDLNFGADNGGDGVVIFGNNVSSGNTGLNTISDNRIDSVFSSKELYCMAVMRAGNWEIARNRVTNQYTKDALGQTIGAYWYWPNNMSVHDNLLAHLFGPLETHYLNSTNYQTTYIQDIYNNTLYDSLAKKSTHVTTMAYLDDDSKTTFVGNIIEAKGKGSVYGAFFNTSNSLGWGVERNTFYLDGFAGQEWAFGTNQYTSFKSWKAGAVVDSWTRWFPSVFRDPAKNDFRSKEFRNQNEVPSNNISELDIFSKKRHPISCDRGAIIDQMNIGITIDLPKRDTVCSGEILADRFKVYNDWVDTIPTISLLIDNGVSRKIEHHQLNLLPGDTQTLRFDNPLMLSPWGTGRLKVYLLNSNDEFQDDTVTFESKVIPSPGGSKLINKFDSTLVNIPVSRPGVIAAPIGTPLDFELTAPRGLSNADYATGKGWTAKVTYRSESGRNAGKVKFSSPAMGKNAFISITDSDTAFEDSLLFLVVQVLNEVTGCDTSILQVIHQSATPTMGFITDSTLCNKDTIRFYNQTELTKGEDYLTYHWQFDEKNKNDSSSLYSPYFVYDSAGNYVVTLRVKTAQYGFSFLMTDTLNIKATPDLRFTNSNPCEKRVVRFVNQSSPTDADFFWDFGDGDTAMGAGNIDHTYDKRGVYDVRLVGEKNGCTNSLEEKIRVFEQPEAKAEFSSEICRGEEVQFNTKTIMQTSLFGVRWEFGEGSAYSTQKNTSLIYDSAGKKRVTLFVNSEFGCRDSLSRDVVVKPTPYVDFDVDRICIHSKTNFKNTTVYDKSVLVQSSWYLNDEEVSNNWDWQTDWEVLKINKVKLKVLNDQGCADSSERDVEILDEAIPDFNVESTCSGDSLLVENLTKYDGLMDAQYVWNFNNTDTLKEYSPKFIIVTSDTITVPLRLTTIIEGGCESTLTKGVFIKPQPKTCDFKFTPDYRYAYYGAELTPVDTALTLGGQLGVDYEWKVIGVGDGTTQDENASFQISLPADDTYTVEFTAVNRLYACTCGVSKTISMDRLNRSKMKELGINIFPNPASSSFSIDGLDEAREIQCVNNAGLQINLKELNDTQIRTFDVSNWTPGIYYLMIDTSSGLQTFKLSVID
jgi:PKD repeat protein